MTWKKLFQWVLAVFCALLSAMFAAAFISLYREGAALRAAGDAAAIYTREKLASRLAPLLPVALVTAGLIIGAALPGTGSAPSPFQGPEPRKTASARAAAGVGNKYDISRVTEVSASRRHRISHLRAALAAAALILIIAGICNGGMRDVLYKAINICTECVGLG